jgi:hypothetical protein
MIDGKRQTVDLGTYNEVLEQLAMLVSALESQKPQPQMSMSVRVNMSNAHKLLAKLQGGEWLTC